MIYLAPLFFFVDRNSIANSFYQLLNCIFIVDNSSTTQVAESYIIITSDNLNGREVYIFMIMNK